MPRIWAHILAHKLATLKRYLNLYAFVVSENGLVFVPGIRRCDETFRVHLVFCFERLVASLRGALFAAVRGLLGGAVAIVYARLCEPRLCAGESRMAMVEFL